jgi:hypothetical protein
VRGGDGGGRGSGDVDWRETGLFLGGSGSTGNGMYCWCLACLRLEKLFEDVVVLEPRTDEVKGARRRAGHKNAGTEAWKAPASSWASLLARRRAVRMFGGHVGGHSHLLSSAASLGR